MSTSKQSTGTLEMSGPPMYSDEEVAAALLKVLGTNKVEFRSGEQERAIEAVLNQETPVVLVLPTVGGKSLTFMGPACLPRAGVTIVVAPFQALEKNIIDQCQEKGIDCIQWIFGECRYASVVVVSADQAASEQFITYALKLADPDRKLLRRVVINKCHLTYTASHYRTKLNHLNHLRILNCPMILLTATLPPASVTELIDAMRISNPVIIRACTARLNIRYMVQQCAQ
jgi:superfamily II DNA helicase RecQ